MLLGMLCEVTSAKHAWVSFEKYGWGKWADWKKK